MYRFREATERIRCMRELIRDRVVRTDAERALIITESYRKNENVVPIIKRPLALLDLCSKMTLRVEDFEILVGNRAKYFLGSALYPEWQGTPWIVNEIEQGNWTIRADGL